MGILSNTDSSLDSIDRFRAGFILDRALAGRLRAKLPVAISIDADNHSVSVSHLYFKHRDLLQFRYPNHDWSWTNRLQRTLRTRSASFRRIAQWCLAASADLSAAVDQMRAYGGLSSIPTIDDIDQQDGSES